MHNPVNYNFNGMLCEVNLLFGGGSLGGITLRNGMSYEVNLLFGGGSLVSITSRNGMSCELPFYLLGKKKHLIDCIAGIPLYSDKLLLVNLTEEWTQMKIWCAIQSVIVSFSFSCDCCYKSVQKICSNIFQYIRF